MLSENGELIVKNQDIANTFNDYFGLVAENLNLFQWNDHNGEIRQINVETITENFKNHPSYKIIKKHFNMSKWSFIVQKIKRQMVVEYR